MKSTKEQPVEPKKSDFDIETQKLEIKSETNYAFDKERVESFAKAVELLVAKAGRLEIKNNNDKKVAKVFVNTTNELVYMTEEPDEIILFENPEKTLGQIAGLLYKTQLEEKNK